MRRCVLVLALFFIFSLKVYATPIYFSYDLGIPEERVLVPYTQLYMPGRIINTGSVPIDITVSWGGIWGIPGPVSDTIWGPTTDDSGFGAQFSSKILNPGESFDFTWFNFYVSGEWPAYDGDEYGAAFGIKLPAGASWKQAGCVGNTVGAWKFDYTQTPTTFHYSTFDYTWVNWPPETVIPEPTSLSLLGLGLLGLLFRRKKVAQ
jgi:hypothetical protein